MDPFLLGVPMHNVTQPSPAISDNLQKRRSWSELAIFCFLYAYTVLHVQFLFAATKLFSLHVLSLPCSLSLRAPLHTSFASSRSIPNMALTNHFQQWYAPDTRQRSSVTTISTWSVAQEAFQAAVKRLAEDGDQGKHVILQNVTSLQDIQETVQKSIDEYMKKRKHPKAIKWLQNCVKSINYFSKVFDVFTHKIRNMDHLPGEP